MANIPITDFLDPRLDAYARLTEVQLKNRKDPTKGMFIAESPKVIERALNAGYVPESMLCETRHALPGGQAAEIIARCGDIPVFTAELSVLTQLTGFQLTRGILCAMHRRALPTVEEVCANARRVAILEDVMNPTNVGAIVRSAAALGIDAVLFTPNCADPLYRRAVRVSMGTIFQVPWTFLCEEEADWPHPAMDRLKALGFQTCAMALKEDSYSIFDPRLGEIDKLAIILGTEGDGLTDTTIDGCDYTVKIPMTHGVDSLNVAAASAVAFCELRAR